MRDDYKKQLKDYRQDYTDDEIRHRLKTIKDIRTEHYDNLERILGIKISNELRDIFNSIIGKTIQQQEYQMEDTVRMLDKSYKDVSKKIPELFKDIPNVIYKESIQKAIQSINLKENDLLLITGSLYLSGEFFNIN